MAVHGNIVNFRRIMHLKCISCKSLELLRQMNDTLVKFKKYHASIQKRMFVTSMKSCKAILDNHVKLYLIAYHRTQL